LSICFFVFKTLVTFCTGPRSCQYCHRHFGPC